MYLEYLKKARQQGVSVVDAYIAYCVEDTYIYKAFTTEQVEKVCSLISRLHREYFYSVEEAVSELCDYYTRMEWKFSLPSAHELSMEVLADENI